MGDRKQHNELVAGNADTTRVPARMHQEYLTSLYLHKALATRAYRRKGVLSRWGEIRVPVFLVGTQRDHISPSPWSANCSA